MDRRALILAGIAFTSLSRGAVAAPLCVDADCQERAANWAIGLRSLTGAAYAPFPVRAFSPVTSEFTAARVTVMGFHYALRSDLRVGLKVPAAASIVARPAGAYFDSKAFGPLSLWAEKDYRWRRAILHLSAGTGIPMPWHGPSGSLASNRVLASSAAADSWQSPELFVPGVVPLFGRAELSRSWSGVTLRGALKLPILLRVHDASLPANVTRRVGVLPQFELSGSAEATSWLKPYAALRFGAILKEVEATGRQAHLGSELGASAQLASHVHLRLMAYAALAGALDGSFGLGVYLGLAY